MTIKLGRVSELVCYPVKSMAGTSVESAFLDWHGLLGDRRFAFRRLNTNSGSPWLTASRLPQLILYRPCGFKQSLGEPQPTHVLTPSGEYLELLSEKLNREVSDRFGRRVEMMHLRNGIFDDSTVSVINSATVAHVCREGGVGIDKRRFRANIVLDGGEGGAFAEDSWVGSTLVFGEEESGPAVYVTKRNGRCIIINLDPETGEQTPRVMNAVVQLNDNNAGIYGTVVRTGRIQIHDPVTLVQSARLPQTAHSLPFG
ncbi:MOSC N-terminal beta barrel domain-containing protein [Nodosilinea sp. FACHB-13]|uniref:MOSC domain-containing protein n=1 Tax=Cyanophyceae TaxID=3028117 RepID=UPI00168974E5